MADISYKDPGCVPAPSARLRPTFRRSRPFRAHAHQSLAPPYPSGLPPAVRHCQVSRFSSIHFFPSHNQISQS